MDIWKELEAEGVNRHLLAEVRSFRDAPRRGGGSTRPDSKPRFVYYGKDVWEARGGGAVRGRTCFWQAPRPPEKTYWRENLAALFGRPVWDISMHINVDAASLIGTDTLEGRRGLLPEGPVCQCARLGGFGILDEVNMAKTKRWPCPRHAGFPPGH